MLKYLKLIIIFVGITSFFGCSNKKINNEFKTTHQEAKFTDIFIPLNIKPISYAIGECSYGYEYAGDISALILLYDTEMERLGWDKIASSSNFEYLLFYRKPAKYISISIRPRESKNKSDVFIFLLQT